MKKKAWFEKYLMVYEKPYSQISQTLKDEVIAKLSKRSSSSPLASIVVIAYNEASHLFSNLWSLADNICDFPIEIIVVNNASTDNTKMILDELGVVWYNEENKGPGFARQCGLDHARGKYCICIDADTIYPAFYISTHIHFLLNKDVICTYTLWKFIPSERYSRANLFLYECFRDLFLYLQNIKRPELCVRGMTMAFDVNWGQKVGFRTDIIRGEDGMMAFKLKEYGKLLLIKKRDIRPMTNSVSISHAGGIWKNIIKRLRGIRLYVGRIFTSKSFYKDRDYNLIDKK